MSQEKLEVIIVTDDGIMIQDISFMRRSDYGPVLRVPSIEEIIKVTDACSASLKNREEAKEHDKISTELLDMVFEKLVEKHGRENVLINEDKSITVTENGETHKVWVE